jgi:pyruvate ferredoxin oxidoreductase delta subunit
LAVKSEKDVTWKDVDIGAIVTEPGSASQYETGGWRSQRPVVDFDKCIKCAMCYIFCPEGCIHPDEGGYYTADLYYCKGCGICAMECPKDAITMIEEEE